LCLNVLFMSELIEFIWALLLFDYSFLANSNVYL
jgi:hypothetical protein